MHQATAVSAADIKTITYLCIKRAVDIIAGIVGLIILIPIALVIKIVSICNGDFHKIIFVQKRIGKNGKEFDFYKFRSMIPNADEVLFKMLEENEEIRKEYEENKKLKDDPRITKVGKFIRRYSIDELPQLINVLKGDMTLVGNRPYLPREKDDMGKYYKDIVKTKPGVTGYWQVSGRSDITFKNRLKLEQYYSNNCGLRMDINIIFKTFGAVIGHKGAK
ncbi:MAG: sugar transferase [Candidatus Coprovivens sp.]